MLTQHDAEKIFTPRLLNPITIVIYYFQDAQIILREASSSSKMLQRSDGYWQKRSDYSYGGFLSLAAH